MDSLSRLREGVVEPGAEVFLGLEVLPQFAAEGGIVVEPDHDLAIVLAADPQEIPVGHSLLLDVGKRRRDLHGEGLVEPAADREAVAHPVKLEVALVLGIAEAFLALVEVLEDDLAECLRLFGG